MADFPSTTQELDAYLDSYLSNKLSDALRDYISANGAAVESNGQSGDVPLVDNVTLSQASAFMAALDNNGMPVSYQQARLSTIGEAITAPYPIHATGRAVRTGDETRLFIHLSKPLPEVRLQ